MYVTLYAYKQRPLNGLHPKLDLNAYTYSIK